MEAATDHLRGIARAVVDEALARGPLRGALLAGSAGRGDADEWSDVDLLLYVDELPPEGTLDAIRGAVGGVEPRPKARHGDDAEALVLEELPELELPFRFPSGTRQRPHTTA